MSTKVRTRLEVEQMENRLAPSATDFVRGLYADVLRRVGSDNEVNAWVQQLNGGVTGRAVADAFVNSDEHHKVQVDVVYTTVLNRPADTNGETYWVQRMRAGTTITEVERSLLLSLEYQNSGHILNSDFVNGVYQDALGRAPDSAGSQFWQAALNNGAIRRDSFVFAIQNSTEYLDKQVGAFYQLYLHRNSSSDERTFWADLVQSGQSTLEKEAVLFLSSAEYEAAHRFSG